MEDLAHIVTFVQVVKAGSFAAAARQLKVTGTVASKHVAKLEHELGIRLLHRSTRKLSLTEAGTTYYPHCARIVEEVDNARRALAQLQTAPRGLLRVTVPVPVAGTLGPALREFLQRYPEIQLDLDASNRVVDLAAEGYDLAIRASGKSLPSSNLVARLLRSLPLQLCAAPEYLQRRGTPRHPGELSQHNCLILPVAMPDSVWRFTRGSERVEVKVHGAVQTDALETLRDLVLNGTGLTLLPDEMADKAIRKGRLIRLLKEWEIEPRVNLYAVYLPTPYLPPKVRAFIDFLVESLGS